ncbi:MAG: hypothetical protein CMJ87_11145 [Planctomycetes bacterium]|nr:hypothetical protein [Planctomycetota bacterium]
MDLRRVTGLVALALALWLALALLNHPAPAAPPVNFDSSNRCAECHPAVFDEWKSSWHARSWDDPDVRALSNDFANTDCIDCHAPRPVFSTGVGKRVLPRAARRSEGVDCIACHLIRDADTGAPGVAGTIDRPGAACRPRAMLDLQRPDYCGVCHDQHKTVRQWRASSWAERGIGCIDCHMPLRNDDPNQGRDHSCRGGHDLELVRSAVELRGKRDPQNPLNWVLEVENVGAGHHFPTDERSRAADLFWRPLVAVGATNADDAQPGPWRHLYRFRDPYRHETDIPATHLAAGETRRVSLGEEEARAGAEVALFYKLTPYYENPDHPDPEREARLVHSLTLKP